MASSDASIRFFGNRSFGRSADGTKQAKHQFLEEIQEFNGGGKSGAFQNRTQLKHAKKVVIKMGSAVITRLLSKF